MKILLDTHMIIWVLTDSHGDVVESLYKGNRILQFRILFEEERYDALCGYHTVAENLMIAFPSKSVIRHFAIFLR